MCTKLLLIYFQKELISNLLYFPSGVHVHPPDHCRLDQSAPDSQHNLPLILLQPTTRLTTHSNVADVSTKTTGGASATFL